VCNIHSQSKKNVLDDYYEKLRLKTEKTEVDKMMIESYDASKNENFKKATQFYEIRDFDMALKYYSAALNELNNDFVIDRYYGCINSRGIYYSQTMNYNQAIQDFTKYLNYMFRKYYGQELGPIAAEVYYNRGNCYANLKNYNIAIIDYNEAIRISINCINIDNNKDILKKQLPSIYNNRGICYTKMDDYQSACRDFQLSLDNGGSEFTRMNITKYCQ